MTVRRSRPSSRAARHTGKKTGNIFGRAHRGTRRPHTCNHSSPRPSYHRSPGRNRNGPSGRYSSYCRCMVPGLRRILVCLKILPITVIF